MEWTLLFFRFNPATYAHDIAVLKMSSPVDFTKTPHISPVCLPTKPFKDHKKCFIVGWGDDVYKVKHYNVWQWRTAVSTVDI